MISNLKQQPTKIPPQMIDPKPVAEQPKDFKHTLWDKIEDLSSTLLFRTIVPILFILVGLYILYTQFSPQIKYYFVDKSSADVISAIGEPYYQSKKEFISSPDFGYFNKVISQNADNTNELDLESKNYNGIFKLTIPSINITNAPVKANVASSELNEYTQALKKNLAHFAGTPIPGKPGNVFIYGHSINEAYFKEDPTNPYIEFTKLFRLKLGDKISIERDNVVYNYTIFKIKEVAPDRLDVLQLDNKSEKLLTLMTCGSPPGNSASRFIVVARQDE